MTGSQPTSGQPAPVRGPDFVLEKVASWVERPNADSELVLRDGSSWKLRPGTEIYEAQRNTIAGAIRRKADLFVSGDRTTGRVDRLTGSTALAVQKVSSKEVNGRYSVTFHGPPSIYYLRTDRPWAAEALLLLRRSATSGAFLDSPDLLVAIDPVASEIVAVKPLDSPSPGVSR
jgi:hypothetical protein